jgi:hypothetical protein
VLKKITGKPFLDISEHILVDDGLTGSDTELLSSHSPQDVSICALFSLVFIIWELQC